MTSTAPANITLYTQRADPALAAQVVRIAGKTGHFATDFMGRVEDGENPVCVRLEAAQDPDTGLWRIDRFTRLPLGAESATRQETEARTGLCFFDVLHYLARFQRTEAEIGKQPVFVAGERWSGVMNYKDAAKEAGQALDTDGEVHPCAFGRILTEGFFSDAAYQAAAATKNQPLPDTALTAGGNFVTTLTAGLLESSPAAQQGQLDPLAQAVDRIKLINVFRTVCGAGENFRRTFAYGVDQTFRGVYSNAATDRDSFRSSTVSAIFTLGLAPVLGYARGDAKYSPSRAVQRALQYLKDAAGTLPDCAEKTLVDEFIRAAAYAISMERAAAVYALVQKSGKSPKSLRKGLPFIEAAARIINLSPVDVERLKADYLRGKVTSSRFCVDLSVLWKGGRANMECLIETTLSVAAGREKLRRIEETELPQCTDEHHAAAVNAYARTLGQKIAILEASRNASIIDVSNLASSMQAVNDNDLTLQSILGHEMLQHRSSLAANATVADNLRLGLVIQEFRDKTEKSTLHAIKATEAARKVAQSNQIDSPERLQAMLENMNAMRTIVENAVQALPALEQEKLTLKAAVNTAAGKLVEAQANAARHTAAPLSLTDATAKAPEKLAGPQ